MTSAIGQLWVVSIPMRVPFRGITNREMVIFKGERFAEWSPFIEYSDEEAAVWLGAALKWAHDKLPNTFRDSVPTNATLPAVNPDQVEKALEPFGEFQTVKVKVAQQGENLEQDIARIAKVAQLYPTAKIRLDANGGFSIEQALALTEQLSGFEIEYLEQPVAKTEDLATLRQALAGKFKIAADESIRKASDPQKVAKLQAADIVMLKAQPLGGIERALETGLATNLDLVVSSALESSIGIAQGAYLAAAIPTLKYDCGLATTNLLQGDVCKRPMSPIDSKLELEIPEADPDLLRKFAAPQDRVNWWHSRLERCLKLL